MKSTLLRLNLSDWTKGLFLAVIVAVFTTLNQIVQASGLNLHLSDLKTILGVAVASLIAYLLKNLSTNSEDKILSKEPAKQ